jgi:hypothetical protein
MPQKHNTINTTQNNAPQEQSGTTRRNKTPQNATHNNITHNRKSPFKCVADVGCTLGMLSVPFSAAPPSMLTPLPLIAAHRPAISIQHVVYTTFSKSGVTIKRKQYSLR